MSKATITKLFVGRIVAVVAGVVLGFAALWAAFVAAGTARCAMASWSERGPWGAELAATIEPQVAVGAGAGR